MIFKKIRVIMALAFVILVIGIPIAYSDGGDARSFLAGIEAYQKGDYDAAAKLLFELVQAGATNPKLYYNLGNAYLKLGDLGRAILWYEKALKIMPNNPDLRFNLNYARSLTKDMGESEDTSLARIFFFWKYQLSAATVIIIAIVCNLLFWLTTGAYRLTRRRGLRTAALIILIPTLVFALTAGYNYFESSHRQDAVILPGQVAVRAGLEETSTTLFELHAGAKVRILKQLKDYYQVRFSEDKLGWVKKDVVGVL